MRLNWSTSAEKENESATLFTAALVLSLFGVLSGIESSTGLGHYIDPVHPGRGCRHWRIRHPLHRKRLTLCVEPQQPSATIRSFTCWTGEGANVARSSHALPVLPTPEIKRLSSVTKDGVTVSYWLGSRPFGRWRRGS